MKSSKSPVDSLIQVKFNKQFGNLYDIDFQVKEDLKNYSSIETHIFFLPYSRKLNARNITFYPYEEYVKDIVNNERSVYSYISYRFDKTFGLLLAILIFIVFAIFKPSDLISVQSVVSIFGAYAIGREMWSDFENFLINLTKNWKIGFQQRVYSYQVDRESTLSKYSFLAESRRYGISSVRADKMEFVEQSNSQTARLYFKRRNIKKYLNQTTHLLSIHAQSDLILELKKFGFLIGTKISLNTKILFLTFSREYFQSIDKGEIGALDSKNKWFDDSVFYKSSLNIGNLKISFGEKILAKSSIFSPK